MVDPSDEGSKFYYIMGVRPGCENCAEFVLQCLHGWSFDDFVEKKNNDDEEGEAIMGAMQIWGREDKTLNKPCMEGGCLDEIGFEAYEKFSMLNPFQVNTEYNKAPTSLNMKPKWFPSSTGPKLFYLCERTAAFKLKYPTVKVFIKTADVVQTQKTAISNRKALWDGHSSMVLTGLSKSREAEIRVQGVDCNASVCMGINIATHEQLEQRASLLTERYGRRKSRRSSGASTVTSLVDDEDLEIDDVDGDSNAEDAEAIVLWRDPDAAQSSSPAMKRAPSTGSLRGGDGKKTTKVDPPPPNPHPLGTSMYWISEMKFEHGLDNITLLHPFNQARILAPKLCQEERDMLIKKRDLCQYAIDINYQLVGSVTDQDCISFMATTGHYTLQSMICFEMFAIIQCPTTTKHGMLFTPNSDLVFV